MGRLDRAILHRRRQGLGLGRIRFLGVGIAQLLHLGIVGPAEPGLVAVGDGEVGGDRIEDVGRDGVGVEGAPAALVGRILLGAARDQRLPVHRLHVDLEATLLEQRLGDRRHVGEHRKGGRLHEHDRCAVVARLLQQRLGFLEVRLGQQVALDLDAVGRAADESGRADLVILLLSDRRLEVILLPHRMERGLADLGIVERLGEPVETDDELLAERVPVHDLNALVGLQHRNEIVRHLLDHVDLAGDQRVHLLLRVGHVDELDAIDLGDLAAGER